MIVVFFSTHYNVNHPLNAHSDKLLLFIQFVNVTNCQLMFLLSSFAIIVYILTSVQSVDNTDTNVVGKHSKINEALWSKNQKFNTFLNKYDFHNNDLLMDESQVIENKDENPNDHTLKQLKNVLSKFLKKNKVSKRYVSGKLGK